MAVQTEWLEKDYYEVLGVAETATDKEIQRAYRRLARQHHPDANAGGDERFKEISAAYDVLGDAGRRKEYDDVRRMAAAGPAGGVRFGTFDDFGGFDGFADVFGDLFGSRPRRGPGQRTVARRGRDLEASLQLGFEQAVYGLTTTVRVTSDGGARDVKVRIPAGVEDGQLIRLPERGGPGRDGGPPGDLFVRVHVAPHPRFGRSGHDLTLRVPVTYPEAVLGAEVKVPTLDDGPVTLRIPAGTPSGRTLRVRGHGIPRANGTRGDLLVTVDVAVPKRVSAKERKAVEALAAAMTDDPRADLEV